MIIEIRVFGFIIFLISEIKYDLALWITNNSIIGINIERITLRIS